MKKEVKHVDPCLTGTWPKSRAGPWGQALLSSSCQTLLSRSPAPSPPPSFLRPLLFFSKVKEKKVNIFLNIKPLWTRQPEKEFSKIQETLER